MIPQRACCTPPLGPRPSPCAVAAVRRGGAARGRSASASGASWRPATSAASGTTSRWWRSSTRAGSCGYTSAARGWATRPGGRSVTSSATPPFPQCKVENLENEDILHKYKYKLQDEDISLNFVEERPEMQCTDCKIIRDTRDKFLNHLNSINNFFTNYFAHFCTTVIGAFA